MTASDGPGREKRGAVRVLLLREVHFSAGRTDARGILHDVSTTGARIEETPLRVKPGTVVRITLPLVGEFEPVQVRGEVVRETDTGFAVKFVDSESVRESLERWLDSTRRQARGEGRGRPG